MYLDLFIDLSGYIPTTYSLLLLPPSSLDVLSIGQCASSPKHPRETMADETETLRWEDVIDYDMWPKSPPDSD